MNTNKKLLYDKVWKFDIKNIYPKYIKVYTGYRSNCWLRISCQQKNHENSEKLAPQDKFEVN